ncbi:unnamed protein product, partial [Ectocarpus sp. 8 AP-2014]
YCRRPASLGGGRSTTIRQARTTRKSLTPLALASSLDPLAPQRSFVLDTWTWTRNSVVF